MIVFILNFLIIRIVYSQYDTTWIIPIDRSYTTIRIAAYESINTQHILLGDPQGKLKVIQSHTNQNIAQLRILDEPITQIEIDDTNGIIFIVGSVNIAQLDHKYNIRKILKFSQKISNIKLSKNGQNYFINYKKQKQILSRQYIPEGQNRAFLETTVIKLQQPLSFFQMSSNHQYIYVVGKDKMQLNLYEVNLYYNLSKIEEKDNIDYHIQILNKIERNYHFKIKDIQIDRSLSQYSNQNDAILVNQQEDIFFIRQGNIVTYIPYSTIPNQKIILTKYCQNLFFLILHEKTYKSHSQFYLSFIQKDNLFSHKVILLNSLIPNLKGIQNMDCNHNLIAIKTTNRNLLILESYPIFQIQEYIYEILGIAILSSLILIFGVRNTNLKPQNQFKQSIKDKNVDKKQQTKVEISKKIEQPVSKSHKKKTRKIE